MGPSLGCPGACRCFDGLVLFRSNFRQASIGDRSYWDAAYAAGTYKDTYEWLQTGSELWPYIEKAIGGRHNLKFVHVGCGNSDLGKCIADAGHSVVNVDYSSVVIEAMRKKFPHLEWLEADCAVPGALGQEGTYDICIDKGGLDALVESYTEHMMGQARGMVAEIYRVLKPGGIYLLFSNGGDKRMELLEKHFSKIDADYCEGFSMDLYQKFVYVFVATK